MTRFAPHGDHRLEVRDHVIIIRICESSNREGIERVVGLMLESAGAFQGAPWGLMLVFESVVLLTPDAEPLARQAHRDFANRGMKGLAMVMPDIPSRAITEAFLKRVHGDTPCPLQGFDQESEASAWLTGLITAASQHQAA